MGLACPVSVGMYLPQPAQTVRSVRFPSARRVEPLIGMARLGRFPDHVQPTWVPVRGRVPDPCNSIFHVRLDQGAIASHPPPDEHFASIATAPKVSADVPARKPNHSASDLAEKRRTRRAQDPHVTEAQELIVFRVHLHDTPYRSPRRAHVGRGDQAPAQIALRGSKRACFQASSGSAQLAT